MQQAGQAADLAMYAKGLALTRGHVWNDTGTNLVGIRNDVQSSKATLDNDMYLHIEGNELKNVFFGSTQPGEKSYEGSGLQGGVGQVFLGNYHHSGFDHEKKNQHVGKQRVPTYPGARDANADGVHNNSDGVLDDKRAPISGAWIHSAGGSFDFGRVSASNGKIVAELKPAQVNNWSQACQVIFSSYHYNVQSDKAETFLSGQISKAQRQHGSYNVVDQLLWDTKQNQAKSLNYSLVSRNDFANAPGILAALDSYRNNARRGYLDALIDKFIRDNIKYNKFKGIDKWQREYKF